ncbi:unnamed protein product [[Candida] boidinii]|nr:unnamed protein product [[Candida] boidinii]
MVYFRDATKTLSPILSNENSAGVVNNPIESQEESYEESMVASEDEDEVDFENFAELVRSCAAEFGDSRDSADEQHDPEGEKKKRRRRKEKMKKRKQKKRRKKLEQELLN